MICFPAAGRAEVNLACGHGDRSGCHAAVHGMPRAQLQIFMEWG